VAIQAKIAAEKYGMKVKTKSAAAAAVSKHSFYNT
jgi:hypothetical protein